MKWIKRGLIYGPPGNLDWIRHSALQPTPLLLDNGAIRVYCGFRDDAGVARVGLIDLDADNPSRVLRVSDRPALDIGAPGTFDDNGVVPCAAVIRENKIHLYYAGYQLARKVKFLAFGGLAISQDGGESFQRYKTVPIFERTTEEPLFRAIHCIFKENDVWKAWYSAGNEFIEIDGVPHPAYDTRHIESADGLTFQGSGEVCISLVHAKEYRVGRPSVIKASGLYRMFYSWATTESGLRLGYAESADGRHWKRLDDRMNIAYSATGWDSKDMGYPNIFEHKGRFYLFYNGNDFGRSGFGFAELAEW